MNHSRDAAQNAPSIKIVRPLARNPTSARGTIGRINHLFIKFVSHILFAYFVDFILMLMQKKRIMVKVTHKMHRAFTVLEHFTNREWCFHARNYPDIHNRLHDMDKQIFFSNSKAFVWRDYAHRIYFGTRRYLLKEDDSNIEKARRRLRYVAAAYTIFQLLLLALIWFVVIVPSGLNAVLLRNLNAVFELTLACIHSIVSPAMPSAQPIRVF